MFFRRRRLCVRWSDCDVDTVGKRCKIAALSKHVCGMFMDTRRNLTASLIDVPSRRCRGEGERTMFAVTTGMRRRCVTVRYDRCTRMCGVVNRRNEHATDRWGTYLYSLMMIFAFSKEALLEYSCFTKICSNANQSSTSSGCRMPGTGESFSFGGRRH